MLEIFKQRQPSENCLFVGLRNFSNKNLHRIKLFGLYTNFLTLVEFFKNFKSSVEGKNTFVFVFLFMYPG